METIKTIARRRTTCRNFTDELLPREKITRLINDAVWVPSGTNNQPWRFVVITDKAKMKDYSDAAKKNWPGKPEQKKTIRHYVPVNTPCVPGACRT